MPSPPPPTTTARTALTASLLIIAALAEPFERLAAARIRGAQSD